MEGNWLHNPSTSWRPRTVALCRLDCLAQRRARTLHLEPMIRIAFDIDDGVLARMHRDPGEFTRELRIAAAVKWYEDELVSQDRATEIAGVSRAEFVEALGRYGVTPFQESLDELMQAPRAPRDG